MKLAYERPMMRAEGFHANGYVALCEDVPGSTNPVAYIVAKLGNWRWIFDASPNYAKNDGTGDDQWYYNEYNGVLSDEHQADEAFMNSIQNNTAGVNADSDYTGTGTYFLEWSEPNNRYYVYEDESDSGYDPNGSTGGQNVTQSGVGTLQVNGNKLWTNGNGGWNDRYRNASRYGTYNADRSVWQGQWATMSFYNGTNETPSIPMILSN